MGTDRLDYIPESSPAKRGVLTYVTAHEGAHRVRICFSGEIDLSSAYVVEVAVADALGAHHPRHLEVDLAEVRFLDARGIRALIRCRTRAHEAGCRLAVANPQPMIYRVLEITGMLAALAVTPGPGEAIAS